ncbi:MAG: GyrI-like domain-containing protein [Gammaproteobacteria bacterium]
MHKTNLQLPEIKLVGITTRTNNMNEMNQETAKIGSMIQKYFSQGLSNKISHRKTPGITYCVYTNYESDFTGDYSYFIGEEVSSLEDIASDFEKLSIPVQRYTKFTAGPGKMPDVCIHAWQKIWQMDASDLNGNRSYIADFEVYDERSVDPNHTTFDIFIGVKA